MNEQMQKLELAAIAYADSKVPAADRYNDIYHSIVRGKFAELIVMECVNAVMDGTMSGDHYAMRIENHFDSGNGGILYFGDKK